MKFANPKLAGLLCSASVCIALAPSAFAQAAPQVATAAADGNLADTIVVTGSTSKRSLLNASAAITKVSATDLAIKAPRDTVDVLETIPGIFVEGTAGPVSNNYSVRGLPGGGSSFVRLIEDGMPAIYGGLNDDEVFQNDISIDHVESVEGGPSGILVPNAAGASINFISKPLNFDHAGGVIKLSGATFGEERADAWYSAPIKALGDNVAFAVSGYFDSTKGQRDSQFTYNTYHVKAQLEKKWDDGGYVSATVKSWNEHDPYYADQPYQVVNGQITGIPGLSTQKGNIIGSDFANIVMPDSCAAGECTRTFSEKQGIHATGQEYRLDFQKPVNESISVFLKARYTTTAWDFNGVFAGSGIGNSGLLNAVSYLTPGAGSPINALLLQGQTAFPTATQFGIRSLTNGNVISSASALNALNGNGLLEQTWLNRQLINLNDFGSDFGAKWQTNGATWKNNLTVGGMFFSQHQHNDQSAVSNVLNDVTNNSNIYDVVGLNAAGGVVGTLTNNGMLGYGDWGSGISNYKMDSVSVYANDELALSDRLHLDFGVRYEHEETRQNGGNGSPAAVPAGTPGLLQVNPNAFNGTYSTGYGSESPFSSTIGVNYTVSHNLSVYGRYAVGYQTQGTNPTPTQIKLMEVGITYSGHGFTGTIRPFRTLFDNQNYGGVNQSDGTSSNFSANSDTNGVDVDATYRPEAFRAFSLHGMLTYQKSKFNNVFIGTLVNGQVVNSAAATYYDGLTPQRTPSLLYTLTPTFDLPHHLGSIYARYKYIGKIFADSGDGIALPGYGVVGLGGMINITPRLVLNISVDNVTNKLGLTEGNPRQGNTQSLVNGYFYARGITGTNALGSLSYKF